MKAVKNVSLGIKILFWQRRLSNCWVGELFDCEMLEIPIFQTKVDIYIHLSRLTGRLIKLQTQISAWLVRTRMVKQKQHFSILRISPDRKNGKRIRLRPRVTVLISTIYTLVKLLRDQVGFAGISRLWFEIIWRDLFSSICFQPVLIKNAERAARTCPLSQFPIRKPPDQAWDETEAIREKGISFPRRGKLSNLEIFKPSLVPDPVMGSSSVRIHQARWGQVGWNDCCLFQIPNCS